MEMKRRQLTHQTMKMEVPPVTAALKRLDRWRPQRAGGCMKAPSSGMRKGSACSHPNRQWRCPRSSAATNAVGPGATPSGATRKESIRDGTRLRLRPSEVQGYPRWLRLSGIIVAWSRRPSASRVIGMSEAYAGLQGPAGGVLYNRCGIHCGPIDDCRVSIRGCPLGCQHIRPEI